MKITIAAVAALSASVAFADTAHLVHRFTFDGNADDSVVAGVSATLHDGTYETDNTAVRLAGGSENDSYIEFPANLVPKTTGEATIEIFFKPISRGNFAKLFYLGYGEGNEMGFSLQNGDSDWGASFVDTNYGGWFGGSDGSFTNNVRYHVVCSIKDGTSIQLMRSGLTDGTYGFQLAETMNWQLKNAALDYFWIGRGRWNNTAPQLVVEEVRIWDYAFSQADAKASAALGPDTLPTSFDGGREFYVAQWNSIATYGGDIEAPVGSTLIKLGNGVVKLTGSNTGFTQARVDDGVLAAKFGQGLPSNCNIVLNSGAWAPLEERCTNTVGDGEGQISSINGHKLHFVSLDMPLVLDIGGKGENFNLASYGDNIYFNYSDIASWDGCTIHPVTISNRLVGVDHVYANSTSITFAKGFDTGSATRDAILEGSATFVIPDAGEAADEYGDAWSYYSMKFYGAPAVNLSGKLNARGWEMDVFGNTTFNVLSGGEVTAPVLWVGHDSGLTGYHATMNLNGGTATVRGFDGATAGWYEDGFIVGNDTGCDATFNLNSGDLAVNAGNMLIGRVGEGARGYFNQTDGTATFGSWGAIGRYAGAYGEMNISGGTSTMTASDKAMTIAEEDQSEGHLNVSGTGTFVANGFIRVGGNQGKARISVTENGKVVAKRIWSENRSNDNEVSIDGGTVEFTAGGGQLGNVSNLLFGAAGGKIDTGSNNVVLSPDSITGGTLIKKGVGSMAISSATQFDAAGIDVAEGSFALPNAVPIHRYRFDGSLADDYSGEFTATLHGSTALTEDNKAVDVGYAENNDTYISFKEQNQGSFLPESGDMTIECWFTVNKDVPGWAKLFVTGSGTGNNIIITLNSEAHEGNMCITYGGQNYSANEKGNRKFEKGHRYHVVFTMRETSSGNSDIYLIKEDLTDETRDGSIYLPSYGLALNMLEENAAWIAHNWWGNWTAGMTIEEFRVWDRFFDADAVATSKAAGPDVLPQLPAPSCPVTIRQGGVLTCSGTADLRGSVITYESADWLESYFRQNRSASLPMIQASEILTDDQTFSGIPARKGYVLREKNGVICLEWRGGLIVTIR